MAQVPHVVDQLAHILQDAPADVQVDHPTDQQPAEGPEYCNNDVIMNTEYCYNNVIMNTEYCKFIFIWLHSLVMWPSFQYYPVILVSVSMSFQLLLFLSFNSWVFYPRFY